MSTYDIEPTKGGGFDVRRDRRAFAYDLDDLEEAKRRIKRNLHKDKDEPVVFLVEPDGYRNRLRL